MPNPLHTKIIPLAHYLRRKWSRVSYEYPFEEATDMNARTWNIRRLNKSGSIWVANEGEGCDSDKRNMALQGVGGKGKDR